MFPGHYAELSPNKPAVIDAATGSILTYKQLDDSANKISNLLRSNGLQVGDHVALCIENHPRYFEIIWGCHYAGLVYTACSSRLTSDELSYIVNDCGAKAYITSKYKADQATEILDTTPNVQLRLMIDGTVDGYDSFEDALSQCSTDPLDERIDGTDMLYSSGTTGRPKGVRLQFARSPLGTPNALTGLGQFLFSFNEDTIYLSPAPLYHAAPLRWNMSVHRTGGTSVVMNHFDAEDFLRCIERYNVTHTQTVPTMFVRMLKLAP
jgi:acyl-CoA synthetase (AMP-forming)/AMP-acid ligase II